MIKRDTLDCRRICSSALVVLAVTALSATGCAAKEPAARSAGPGGVYVATYGLDSVSDNLPEEVYSSGGAGGIYVRLVWSTIQPARGTYDWSTLDRETTRAKRYGKKVSIGVRTGEDTPTWLYRDGAVSAQFVSGRRGGKAGVCASRVLPAPWNDAYQRAYAAMMSALSAHLKASGTYDLVKIVKITGINERSEETRIPSAASQLQPLRDGACRISDATATWRSIGYRPDKIIGAWQGLARSVNTAFPDKLLAIAIIEENDFPAVDRDGNPVPKQSSERVDVKRAIIESGVKAFPGRFAVQWNGMNAFRIVDTLREAKSLGAKIGLQSNMWSGRSVGAGCGAPRRQTASPCTADTYRDLLQFGEKSGASYLEIWPADATRFGSIVSVEDTKLQQNAR